MEVITTEVGASLLTWDNLPVNPEVPLLTRKDTLPCVISHSYSPASLNFLSTLSHEIESYMHRESNLGNKKPVATKF